MQKFPGLPRKTRLATIVSLGLAWFSVAMPNAVADPGGPPNAPESKAMRAVAALCATDFARLCREQTAADGRDMAICLKLYSADLSLPCRHAVTAALPHSPP